MTEAAAVAVPEKQTSIWTKEVLAALKVANRVVFRFQPRPEGAKSWDPQQVLVEFVRDEKKEEGQPYKGEQRLSFEFEGFIRDGYGTEVSVHKSADYGEMHTYDGKSYKPKGGVWTTALYYQHGDDPTAAALALLPVGAKVRFEVGLDYHTNGYVTKARLHGDVLLAKFEKGKQKGLLEIDHSIVPLNTARFGER